MPDDTTAAIQALMQQVQDLTETVTKQQGNLDGIAKHNQRLLDKIQDQKRSDTNQNLIEIVDRKAEQQRMEDAGFIRDTKGNWRTRNSLQSDGAVVITREEARNAATYQAAKQRASDLGVELRVASDGNDPTQREMSRPDIVKSATHTFDDEHERIRYVREDMHQGNGMVQRTLAAEREGFKLRTFRTPDELPDHARTKFNLIETAQT